MSEESKVIIPKDLEKYVRKHRSTLVNHRNSQYENIEISSFETDKDFSLLSEHEFYEKVLYNSTSEESIKKYIMVINDFIKYLNFNIYNLFNSINSGKKPSDQLNINEFFIYHESINEELLEILERSLQQILSLKEYPIKLIQSRMIMGSDYYKDLIYKQIKDKDKSYSSPILRKNHRESYMENKINIELKKIIEKNINLKRIIQQKELEISLKKRLSCIDTIAKDYLSNKIEDLNKHRDDIVKVSCGLKISDIHLLD